MRHWLSTVNHRRLARSTDGAGFDRCGQEGLAFIQELQEQRQNRVQDKACTAAVAVAARHMGKSGAEPCTGVVAAGHFRGRGACSKRRRLALAGLWRWSRRGGRQAAGLQCILRLGHGSKGCGLSCAKGGSQGGWWERKQGGITAGGREHAEKRGCNVGAGCCTGRHHKRSRSGGLVGSAPAMAWRAG